MACSATIGVANTVERHGCGLTEVISADTERVNEDILSHGTTHARKETCRRNKVGTTDKEDLTQVVISGQER